MEGTTPVRCLTVKDVADVLAVSPSCVYRLVRNGQLKSIKVGTNGRRVTTLALEEFMRNGGAAA